MRGKWLAYIAVVALVIVAVGYTAFRSTPWPSVLLIRHAFAKDAARRNVALEAHATGNVTVVPDQRYGDDSRELVDVYYPADAPTKLPTLIWIHGGAFIAGDRTDLSGYAKVLAAKGYTIAAVGYPLAPGARYPAPVISANEAVTFILANVDRFHVDPQRLFIVGDSAGAQIAAQMVAGTADAAYGGAVGFSPALQPPQIKGVVLFCGIFDATAVATEGPFSDFIRKVLWSYFGTPDITGDSRLEQFSVAGHVTADFPPTFVSVGNADPLAPQSAKLAEALKSKGVAVETLFFPPDHAPPLQHEYQFDLDGEAGKQALARLEAFLAARAN